jgi:hypothetical protein
MSDPNYYGKPSGVRPNMARGPVPGTAPTPIRPSKPVGRGGSRWVLGLVVLVVASAAIFGFMTFVGKSGKEVAQTEQQTIQRGQDTFPQLDLNTALIAAKAGFGLNGNYQGLTAATLAQSEPALHFTDGASTRPGLVSVFANGTSFGAAEVSASGRCFYIRDVGGATGFGIGSGTCTARSALTEATATSW